MKMGSIDNSGDTIEQIMLETVKGCNFCNINNAIRVCVVYHEPERHETVI